MFGRFISYYKPHMKLFLLDMACALAVAVLDMVFPMITRNFINEYIPAGRVDLMVKFSVILAFLYFVRMSANYIMAYWGHIMGSRMEYDMRRDLFRHIQRMPFGYFSKNKTGQIMSRLVGDLREIAELAHHGPEDFFISILMITGSFVILLGINVPLTILVFLFVFLLVAFSVTRRRSMSRSFKVVRRNHAEINAKIEGSLSGIRLSKSFANEDYDFGRFETGNLEYLHSWNQAYKAIGVFTSGTHLLLDLMNLVVLSFGGYFVYAGKIDFGDLVAYLLYVSLFMRPIRRLIQFIQQFESGYAGFERFQEIMDIRPTILDKTDASTYDGSRRDIEFDRVDFAYEDGEAILRGFTLKIEGGETLALVGPSGVGKTTISNLVPRFYDVTGGAIRVGGVDVRDYAVKSLREQIGIVQQDVLVFWGTIRENILYGRPSASEDEVMDAARKASIHEFIMGLPEGYGTFVGEKGVRLSGGQKQRISLARVFLKNPPILILDEATSSLDNETETLIQESIDRLSEGRTTVIIAHRLSTIRKANRIAVLTDEGLSEIGSHEELMNKGGLYKRLFEAQFQGFIPDEIRGGKLGI